MLCITELRNVLLITCNREIFSKHKNTIKNGPIMSMIILISIKMNNKLWATINFHIKIKFSKKQLIKKLKGKLIINNRKSSKNNLKRKRNLDFFQKLKMFSALEITIIITTTKLKIIINLFNLLHHFLQININISNQYKCQLIKFNNNKCKCHINSNNSRLLCRFNKWWIRCINHNNRWSNNLNLTIKLYNHLLFKINNH